jgi:toxin ParE1/3/4
MREQADYYDAEAGEEVGDRFVGQCEATFERLIQFPRLGAKVDLRHASTFGCRFIPVIRFERTLIFYRPSASMIEIIRVLHSARDIQALFEDQEHLDN